MKRAETCNCSLCNKLYISVPPYSCVRQVYKLQSNHHSYCSHRMLLKTILFPIHKIHSLYICSLWMTDFVFWVQNGFLPEGLGMQTSDPAALFAFGRLYPLEAAFRPQSVFLCFICFSDVCGVMNWWLTCSLRMQSPFVSLFGAYQPHILKDFDCVGVFI